MAENCPLITWQEPDFLNVLGLCKDDLAVVNGLDDKIQDQLRTVFRLFGNELFNREVLYYRHLLMSEVNDQQFDLIIQNLREFEQQYNIFDKITNSSRNSDKEAFALMERKNDKFYITKRVTVIGREKKSVERGVEWQVDINLKGNMKCSKQHAVILFNSEVGKFELKCLSSKSWVDVNGERFYAQNAPVVLENGAVIELAGDVFYFFTAKI